MLQEDYIQDTTNLPDLEPSGRDLTRRHLEAIRDEWLGPLLMQMRNQAEEVGRLEAECRQLRSERDRLVIQLDDLRDQLDSRPAVEPEIEDAQDPPPATAIDRLLNLASHLVTAEGAVVTGIAIAIGLWLGIGLLTFAVLG